MEVLKCDITDGDGSTPYKYKFIETVEACDDSLYIYEFTYNNSGISLTLALSSSEVLWLIDKKVDKFDKFIEELNDAFEKYLLMIIELYKKGGQSL